MVSRHNRFLTAIALFGYSGWVPTANRRMKNVDIWTSTGYFSNSTGSPVANCRFFHVIIPWHWKEPPGVCLNNEENQPGGIYREKEPLTWDSAFAINTELFWMQAKSPAAIAFNKERASSICPIGWFVLSFGLRFDCIKNFTTKNINLVLLLMRVGLHWFQALSPKINPSRAISAVETPWRLGLTTSHGS